MKLNLEKDLVIFDIESTGLSTSNDRIVQLAIVKMFADGRENIERCRLINPEMPIPKEASDIHGITNEMVKDAPTFKQVAKALLDVIGDADLCGFNINRFDVPMLLEEFHRNGFELDMTDRKTIDAWKIFQKMEPRTLSAAYQFYCGKKLEGAHDALVDVRATVEVLEGQLDKYKGVNYDDEKSEIEIEPVKNDMQSLHDFSNFTNRLDYSGKLLLNDDGVAVFNYGKYQSQSVVDVVTKNPGYYDWFMKGEFTTDTKRAFERIMENHRNEVAREKISRQD
jgi:DNA polymerase-3 subunit epsilon